MNANTEQQVVAKRVGVHARANNDLIYLNCACILCERSRLNEIDSGFLSANNHPRIEKLNRFYTFRFAFCFYTLDRHTQLYRTFVCRQAWSLCGKWCSRHRTSE